MRFYTKLGHVTYAICHIPRACNLCLYNIDRPWITGFPAQKQPRHQLIKDFTYWHVLCYFNNWKILKLSHKATSREKLTELIKLY